MMRRRRASHQSRTTSRYSPTPLVHTDVIMVPYLNHAQNSPEVPAADQRVKGYCVMPHCRLFIMCLYLCPSDFFCLQAQQLARAGKKLTAAPKAAAAKARSTAAAVDTVEAQPVLGSAGRPVSVSPGTPIKTNAAAQEGKGQGSSQASSEETQLLAELAGDDDADSADACAGAAREQGAPGKEDLPATNAVPPHAAGLTPVKRPLLAKMPGILLLLNDDVNMCLVHGVRVTINGTRLGQDHGWALWHSSSMRSIEQFTTGCPAVDHVKMLQSRAACSGIQTIHCVSCAASEGRITRRQAREAHNVTPAEQGSSKAAAPCAPAGRSLRRRLVT